MGELNARKENLKKCLSYFEIEHINNLCFVTIAVNPKEYYELLEDSSFNKKHKGIKKETSGMDSEGYAAKIVLVNDRDYFQGPSMAAKQVTRISIVDG